MIEFRKEIGRYEECLSDAPRSEHIDFVNSAQEKSWAIETADALFAKHGRVIPVRQDAERKERSSTGAPEAKVTTDEIFILDDWLGVSYAVPNAEKMRRDESTVVRIAELAGRFLSLSSRDQEALS